ncbi:MAG: DNA repair protein RecN [Bacteroidia bacterium]
MLTELRVKNYALIKDLVFKPGQSFNVITGETGAGKSILLGALGLILGERTDSAAVKQNEEKCVVEGFFNIGGYGLHNWFVENEFDYTNDLLLRREILITGKSRAFINDTPAQLTQLKELGKYLIDIHSQHDNLDLFQKSFQFKVLDSFAGTSEEQKLFVENFENLKLLNRKIKELQDAEKSSTDERDYKQFLYEELLAANLIEGESGALEQELLALSSADENMQLLAAVHNQLAESETSIIDQLSLIKNKLTQIAKNDNRFEDVSIRFNDLNYLLKDLGIEIDQLANAIVSDPERLDWVNQRISLLHNLSKKHHDDNLILKLETLKTELSKFANLDSEIQMAKQQKEELEKECIAIAQKVSIKRVSQNILLQNQINELIVQLGMPGAKIKVEVTQNENSDLGAYGIDDTNFLFSPANGKLFNPIQNIASGGEISRVMLVLKTILAKKNIMPTIIFDEIDSGVSGEVAFKMGDMLQNMASTMQLIVITHLPQIAAKGNRHYFVYKNINTQNTSSDIRELSGTERINEIAEMMGGKAFGETIFESAKHLLSN